MGYDSNECLLCYLLGEGNNPIDYDHEHYICGHCVSIMVEQEKKGTNRVLRVLQDCVDIKERKCYLCRKRVFLSFCVCCCDEHKSFYQNEEEEPAVINFESGSESEPEPINDCEEKHFEGNFKTNVNSNN